RRHKHRSRIEAQQLSCAYFVLHERVRTLDILPTTSRVHEVRYQAHADRFQPCTALTARSPLSHSTLPGTQNSAESTSVSCRCPPASTRAFGCRLPATLTLTNNGCLLAFGVIDRARTPWRHQVVIM